MVIYFDQHTTYKSPAEPTIKKEINGQEPLSEFGRALKELGVKLIHAYSPQAKGRIERLFGTLHDRLVKEQRLRGISTIEEANKLLDGSYLREFNRKFSIKALNKENLHRPMPGGINLTKILCIRTDRTVRKRRKPTYHIPSKDHPWKKTYKKTAAMINNPPLEAAV